MATSSITNRWGQVTPVRVDAEHHVVFRAHEGCAYSHHSQITSLGDRLYATWSNGEIHEDDVGQRMVMAASDDDGRTWSEPAEVVSRQPGEHADAVVTSGGIRAHEGRLIAGFGVYEYRPEALEGGHRKLGDALHARTRACTAVSEDEGRTWSQPEVLLDRFVPNLGPLPTTSGRLIMPGNVSFPYTDDASGLSGWRTAGIPRLPEDYVDDSEGFGKCCAARGDEASYCEGSFFQTDDGVLHMMLRTDQMRLAVSESRDDGVTWSEPQWTGCTDSRSRNQFGRLPDGRFFGLTCPDGADYARTPLVLAVSEDGLAFDRHFVLGDEPDRPPRMPGMHKVGRYGYPYMHVRGDSAFAIYSVAKEDIAVCRFGLGSIR